ncbi:MAG: hypothetical protein ACRYG4_04565 [Janthinobacterium lividum]
MMLLAKSASDNIFCFSIFVPESAVIDNAVFWTFSSRFCAVTTIVSSASLSGAAAGPPVETCPADGDDASAAAPMANIDTV